MNIPDIDPIAGNLQQQIEQAAQRSYERLLELIAEGVDPRKATETVLKGFEGEYAGALTQAFSAAMIANVTAGSVLSMPVGDVFLSERLYAHARQTGQEVAAIVRQHAQGLQQARALALSLYDGYNPLDGIKRPLEGVARAELPKALRELTQNPGARQELTFLLTQMQQQASRLKSEALKAGYMEALKAWEQGKGAQVLKQRLWVAEREKTRYMANRIAQTELARAHQDKVAAQIMADDTITVVQVKLNPRHPSPDICDLHARADLWGLGPGLYPKAKAPKPPFHPFCWCRLVTRPDKTAEIASEREGAVREWLRTLEPAEAARVLGNRQRLDYVLNGADWEKVTQAAVREEYRLRRVGEVAKTPAAAMGALPLQTTLSTPDDFIKAGRLITDSLPDGAADPVACHKALLELLEKEVGLSKPCKVASSGAGAKLLKEASMRYPNAWTEAADNFGTLYVKSSANTRGYHRTIRKAPPNGGTHWKTPDFGVVKYEQNMGQIMVRTGDMGNAVHEYAHRLQSALPGLDDLFQQLHRQRTGGDPLKRLKDLEPKLNYGNNELAREDNYTNPYQGREYTNGADGGALEVMTMALEAVLGPFSGHWRSADSINSFRKMYQDDRPMFDFVVGLLRHWKP